MLATANHVSATRRTNDGQQYWEVHTGPLSNIANQQCWDVQAACPTLPSINFGSNIAIQQCWDVKAACPTLPSNNFGTFRPPLQHCHPEQFWDVQPPVQHCHPTILGPTLPSKNVGTLRPPVQHCHPTMLGR